jgi:hypothetical protein
MSRTLCLLATVLVAGCGSSNSITATVSGPYSRTFPVTLNASAGAGGDQVGGLNLFVTFTDDSEQNNSEGDPAMSAVVSIPGNSPQTGSFTSSNVNAAQAHLTSSSSAWQQFFLSLAPEQTVGTFTLTLTAAGELGTVGTGLEGRTPWLNVHGTYAATLPAQLGGPTPGPDPVSITISF